MKLYSSPETEIIEVEVTSQLLEPTGTGGGDMEEGGEI